MQLNHRELGYVRDVVDGGESIKPKELNKQVLRRR